MTFLEALAQVRERGKLIKEVRDLNEFVSDIPKSLYFNLIRWKELHYYYIYDWNTDRIVSGRSEAHYSRWESFRAPLDLETNKGGNPSL